jgi:hypothetical protein
MLVIPIVLLLILFGSVFIGGTYNVFKAVSKPINFFVPTPNWEDINTATLSAERSFLSQGNSYLNQLSNPTGMCESASKCTGKIPSAEAQTAPLRVMFTILLAILLGFLVWLNVKKKGKV